MLQTTPSSVPNDDPVPPTPPRDPHPSHIARAAWFPPKPPACTCRRGTHRPHGCRSRAARRCGTTRLRATDRSSDLSSVQRAAPRHTKLRQSPASGMSAATARRVTRRRAAVSLPMTVLVLVRRRRYPWRQSASAAPPQVHPDRAAPRHAALQLGACRSIRECARAGRGRCARAPLRRATAPPTAATHRRRKPPCDTAGVRARRLHLLRPATRRLRLCTAAMGGGEQMLRRWRARRTRGGVAAAPGIQPRGGRVEGEEGKFED